MAKRKPLTTAAAAAALAAENLFPAWKIYTDIAADTTAHWNGTVGEGWKKEEITIHDIVSKLVQYGSLSPAQFGFLRTLLSRIDERATVAAERAAAKAAAADVPEGKVEIEGVVLTTKFQASAFRRGGTLKMLVAHDSGFKVWGTVPAAIDTVVKGERVAFTATVERSNDDPKFGFFSRPTQARRIEAPEAAA
jgi:hypothetical protein